MHVAEAVASRYSCRAFLPAPVALATVRDIVERAARAPSGGNVQPWHVHVLAGEPLAALKRGIAALTAITTALTSAIPFFAILAGFNGYIAQDSTRLKATAITGEHAPSVAAMVDKVVKAGKRK